MTAVSPNLRLPLPKKQGKLSLQEAISGRRSVREFTDKQLSLTELSQLLWAMQGISDQDGLRTVPSAGALYPLEIYVAVKEGTYHYCSLKHELRQRSLQDVRLALCQAALGQESVKEAAAVFIIAAVNARITVKYGADRGERYVLLECGHAAQNLLLQAVALNLGAVPIGAFHDGGVAQALGLPSDEQIVYLIPVGHPR